MMKSTEQLNAPDPSFTDHGFLSIAEAVPNFGCVGYKSTRIEKLIGGQTVLIMGRVQEIQAVNGKKIYLVVRDGEGSTVRCVLSSITLSGPQVSPEMVKFATRLSLESYVMIKGIVSYPNRLIEGVSRQIYKIEVNKLYCIPNIGAGVDAHIEAEIEEALKAEQECIPIKGASSSSRKIEEAPEAEQRRIPSSSWKTEESPDAGKKCPSSALFRSLNSSKPASQNVASHPLTDDTEFKFDVEAQYPPDFWNSWNSLAPSCEFTEQIALYPLSAVALRNSSSGSNFGMNAARRFQATGLALIEQIPLYLPALGNFPSGFNFVGRRLLEQIALYSPALGNSSSGFNFGTNAGRRFQVTGPAQPREFIEQTAHYSLALGNSSSGFNFGTNPAQPPELIEQMALYSLALGNSSSGFNFGTNAERRFQATGRAQLRDLIEPQTALYPPALGNSSSGFNFGTNAERRFQATDLTAQTIGCHVGYNGNWGSSSHVPIMIGDGDGFLSADESEEEQRPQVNQMDFPPSTSEATFSPRMSILSHYPRVSVPSASGALNVYGERLQTSDLGLAQMLTRSGQGLAQMFRLALDGLGAIGTKEMTKLSFNILFGMTACLVAYYIYLNSGSSSADQGSSSAAQLSKPLFYSVAVANTVGFLACWVGIAIRNSQPRAGSILGGTGAVIAAASFFLVMSTFIPKI